MWYRSFPRIVLIVAAGLAASSVDSFIGMPIVMTTLALGLMVIVAHHIWLSRKGGLGDLRYCLATAIFLLFLAAFALVSVLPLYPAIAAKMGWPAPPIALLAN